MKRALVVALALAIAAPFSVAAGKTAPAAVSAERGVPAREITSPGGIKAWLVSDPTVPMIVMQASWRGGSALDPAGKDGAISIMADMLTEGAGDLDANAFKVRLEELNMSLGYAANWDGVGMTLTTLTRNRDAAFAMAQTTLEKPRFDPEPLARIKRQMEVGIRTRETNQSFIANRAMDEALIAGHPYARRASLESVRAIAPADLASAKRSLLTRDSMIVSVVGDIDEATLGALLDKTFAALPASARRASLPQTPTAPAAGVIVKTLPQPQSLVLFQAPGIQDEDPDWISLSVANYIIGGGGSSSRLMDEVREKRGLVYGIGMSPSLREFSATVRGSAQTENKDVKQTIDVVRAELKRAVDQGVTDKEVEDAKRYLTGSFALDLDSNSKIVGMLHSYQWQGRSVTYVNERNGLINAVTRADVERVIDRLFKPEAFTFVVVGQPEGLTQ
jgi:zinc protease